MDYQLLVDKILSKVMEKLSVSEESSLTTNKSNILILSEQHQTICHELLEEANLKSYGNIDCAYLKDYCCNVEEYDTIVIYHLSNQALSKISGGICDTPFTQLAAKAILLGKKVLIPKTEVELYQYEQTAPKAYYDMMRDKIRFLEDAGIIFCDQSKLKMMLVGQNNKSENSMESMHNQVAVEKVVSNAAVCSQTVTICKKVITESDIRKLVDERTSCIYIESKAILSDLAKEYLQNRRIEIQRNASLDGK